LWLPVVLALGGGLLYGIYKALDYTHWPPMHRLLAIGTLLGTSTIAGFVGYLIADLDLLGLKLDPNLLRTYPLLGFAVAYIGVDTLVIKRLSPPGSGGSG
jgi:hypothetical protein